MVSMAFDGCLAGIRFTLGSTCSTASGVVLKECNKLVMSKSWSVRCFGRCFFKVVEVDKTSKKWEIDPVYISE